MGKSNKANRTKGNTRPSSSEHSAHLLSQSGKSVSGFIGFGSLEKDIPSYVPVTGQHSSDVCDLSVDSDFRMVMRKMLKRDSITRLKAVQEFGDLCSEKDKDTLKNVLPFWPRLFNKLALDYDRRIREAAHLSNGKLISNVKREIAPYLKNIMGVWLLGQNDLHAPAASAAYATFVDTFPKAKQSEALMHCKNEVFSLFKDNLFEQTAKSMSDPNSTSVEDMENKYNLVISATLQAMKLFLMTVSSNEISDLKDTYMAIITENKFWKYSKNKEPQIRGSWYALISHLCHLMPDVFADMEKKVATTVFSSLSESDPVVAPAVWEAALHVVVSFKNCWREINIHKVVLPQLWSLLNEAGRGNAHIVYPCILPFLSKFPKEVISKDTFLLQFFTCLKQSLLLDSVKLSSMECDAILTTFMECLQYICFCVLDDTKEAAVLLEKVLIDLVLPVVEISFYESKSSYIATSKLYSLLGSLIQKIETKCLKDKEDEAKAFSQTITSFWNNMYNLFCKLFDKRDPEKLKASIYLTYFFHSIFIPSAPKTVKSKVRFKDEKDEDEEYISEDSSQCSSSVNLYKEIPLTFTHIIKFIKILCLKTNENVNLCYLKILDEILASTLSEEFLKDIFNSFEESSDTSGKTGSTFFDSIVLKWVTVGNLDASSFVCISDIVFSLCSSVSEEEALEMLNSCCKVKNALFLEKILSKGLDKYSKESVIQNWLKSPILLESIINGFKEMMESLAKEDALLEESADLPQKNIMHICLYNKTLIESLNKDDNIKRILDVCMECTEKELNCKNEKNIIEIICRIFEVILINFQVCWKYPTTDLLLLKLFKWKVDATERGLKDKGVSPVSRVWYFAILCAHRNKLVTPSEGFLMKAAQELHLSLCNLLTSKKASHIFDETMSLLNVIKTASSSVPDNYAAPYVLSDFLENMLLSDLDWQELRNNLVLSPVLSILERKIMYSSASEDHKIAESDINKLYFASKVISSVFTKECQTSSSCSDEDEQYFEQYMLKFLPNFVWCLSYFDGNGYLNEDSEAEINFSELDSQFEAIIKSISYEKLKELLRNIFYCSLSEGFYWALPFQFLLKKIKNCYEYSGCVTLFDDLISETSMVESDYVSLNVQILSHYVSKEKKIFYLKNLLGDLSEKSNSSSQDIDDEYLRKFGEICCFIQDSDVIDEEIQSLLTAFFIVFPYDECPADSSLFHFEFVSLMFSIVHHCPHVVTKNAWNFLQSLLLSYLKKPVEMDDLISLFQMSLAFSASFSFISANEGAETSWTPSVSDETNEAFLSHLIYILGSFKKFHPLTQAFNAALASLLRSVEYIPENVIFNFVMTSDNVPPLLNLNGERVLTALEALSSLLLNDNLYIQLATHLLLMKAMPLLSESLSSAKCECSESDDDEEKVPSKLLPLVDTLILLSDLMENIMDDIKIGDCCLVMPKTEPYTFVSAYLFAWLEMLEFISTSPSQVRSGYVAHLEETKLVTFLFSNVFRLMPDNPASCLKKLTACDSPKKENLASLFLHAPKIDAGNISSEQIQMISCYVFCTAARKVPASVRIWWNNLDKNSADIVNKFTSKYISGILCAEEIQAVYSNEKLFQNMVVKARLGSREVIATYTVDDSAIELCVQLPANYPLGPLTAEKRGKIVIANQEWRHWLMQLTTVLNYQNGSILDGLNIWKKNLDKKFEGVEECMICYYILHNSTNKLPKLSCHTCRKKFHSTCLYKWFKSINNTKCPICRNEFII